MLPSRPPWKARRRVLLGLAALPLASRSLGAAPGGEPTELTLEALFFRQPGTPAAAVGAHGPPGPTLAPLIAGLRRGGYTLLGAAQTTLSIAPGATGAARLEDLLPGAGLSGHLSIARSQILVVHLSVHCGACRGEDDIDEHRRVKFGERHYFDGPLVAAIVAVDPPAGTAPA